MSESAQKCLNNAFYQSYTIKLVLLLKWPIVAVSGKGEI